MKKDVYKYYMAQIDAYTSMKNQLEEITKTKTADKNAVEYISNLLATMEANVQRLSYVMYLLKMPLFGKARKAYEGKFAGLNTLFEKFNCTESAVNAENDAIMSQIITFMESLPDVTETSEIKTKSKPKRTRKTKEAK